MRYDTVDLRQTELQNVKANALASAPTNPVAGQLYYSTATNTLLAWNGTTWLDLTKQGTVTGVTATSPVTSTGGTAPVIALSDSGVTAGSYAKVTVSAKGLVTAGGSLTAADIPNHDWSKITSGKPTTLAGYGITDGITNFYDTPVFNNGVNIMAGNSTDISYMIDGNAILGMFDADYNNLYLNVYRDGGDLATNFPFVQIYGNIVNNGNVAAQNFTSTVATGAAPFNVSSTTKVNNLHADMVDGFHFDQALLTTSSPTFANLTIGSAGNVAFGGGSLVTYNSGSSYLTFLAGSGGFSIANNANNKTLLNINGSTGGVSTLNNILDDGTTGQAKLKSLMVLPTTTLGSTAGNSLVMSTIQGTASTNGVMLETKLVRGTAGSDWQTAILRLQKKTDATLQQFIDFTPGGDINLDVSYGGANAVGMYVFGNGGYTAKVIPYAPGGSYNPIVQTGDTVFTGGGTGPSTSNYLVIAPWSGTSAGIRMKGDGTVVTKNNILDDGSGNMKLNNGTIDTPEIRFHDPVNNTYSFIDQVNETFRVIASYRGGSTKDILNIYIPNNQTTIYGDAILAQQNGTASNNWSSALIMQARNSSGTVKYGVVQTDPDGNLYLNQSGLGNGVVKTKNNVLDSGSGDAYVTGSLSALGLVNRGFDFILGSGDQTSRGNSGGSRVLVKDIYGGSSVIKMNFAGDFPGGVIVEGPSLTTQGSLTTNGVINAYGSMEIGSLTVASSPYIDFHSSGNNIDFDTRIISTGGNASSGQGQLTLYASSYQLVNGSYSAIVKVGAGTPEGVITAPVGSLYLRTDGGAGTTLYVKQSGTGNTGWVGK